MVTRENLELIQRATLEACDAGDGVRRARDLFGEQFHRWLRSRSPGSERFKSLGVDGDRSPGTIGGDSTAALLRKLRVSSRAEAAALAGHAGLLGD